MIAVLGIARGGTNAFGEWLSAMGAGPHRHIAVGWPEGEFGVVTASLLDPQDFANKAKGCRKVLILRDWRNVLASNVERKAIQPWIIKRKWKALAEEFAGHTNCIPDCLKVRYEEWHRSEEYRRGIAESLGLTFDDSGKSVVPKVLGGSSFDGVSVPPDEMNVMKRYEQMAGKERFHHWIRKDPGCKALDEAIFGPWES